MFGNKSEDRFVRVYQQGALDSMEVWVDQVTGVNYLFHRALHASSVTPLLNPDGTPMVTPIRSEEAPCDEGYYEYFYENKE